MIRYKNSKEGLFPLETEKYKLYSNNTACHSGYIAIYSCKNNELFLDSLGMNSHEKKKSKLLINGIEPSPEKKNVFLLDKFYLNWLNFTHYYYNLNFKLNYTGTIRIKPNNDNVLRLLAYSDKRAWNKYSETSKLIELLITNGIISDEKSFDQFLDEDGNIIYQILINFLKNSFSQVLELKFNEDKLVSEVYLKYNQL